MSRKSLSRRRFLLAGAGLVGASLLAACGQAATPSAAPADKPAAAPAPKPTEAATPAAPMATSAPAAAPAPKPTEAPQPAEPTKPAAVPTAAQGATGTGAGEAVVPLFEASTSSLSSTKAAIDLFKKEHPDVKVEPVSVLRNSAVAG